MVCDACSTGDKDIIIVPGSLTYPTTAKKNEIITIAFTVEYVSEPFGEGDAEVYFNIVRKDTEECMFNSEVYNVKLHDKLDMEATFPMPTDKKNIDFLLSVKEQDVFFDDCEDTAEFTIELEGEPEPPGEECRNCTSKKRDAIITELLVNPQVKEGEQYNIKVTVKANTLFLDIPVFLTVYNKDSGLCITSTDSKLINHGGSVTWNISGLMPDHDLNIRLNAIDDTLIFKDCQDYTDFIIKKGNITLPPDTPPGFSEPSFLELYYIPILILLAGVLIIIAYFKYYKK